MTSRTAQCQPESGGQRISGFLQYVYAVLRQLPWLYDIERDRPSGRNELAQDGLDDRSHCLQPRIACS